ncbi:MAG: DNA polymerase III subunit delta [Alkalibacterium sp.]|nr:DNA polymerase III subunit delta [Alkalibacterium sp.]TVP92458.1 MAG: DNA polymerase III subunit delta [Alkalibacterium sp.]
MKTVDKTVKAIKKEELKRCYLIWGTEELLLERLLAAFNERMKQDDEDPNNIIHFNLNDTPIDDVIHEAESFPFFGQQKLLFVHDSYIFSGKKAPAGITHNIEKLESYVSNPSDFSILIFIAPYEKLDKRKKITKTMMKSAETIEANPASGQETKKYIQDFFTNKGFKIDNESLELLLRLTDYNLSLAMREAEKLTTYLYGESVITGESVQKLVSKSLEQNIFDLNERLLNKNVKEAIELYQDLLTQKEDPIKILALMISQFRLLIQVKILKSKGYQQSDIASILKVHPYRVKLAGQKEKLFSQSALSQAHHLLITADYEVKTGKINPELQVELFIWQFANL